MKKLSIFILIVTAVFLFGCTDLSNNDIPVDATVGSTTTEEQVVPDFTRVQEPTITQTTEPLLTEPEPVIHNDDYIKVSFLAAGDNLIHTSINNQAQLHAQETGKDYDYTYVYKNIESIVRSVDLAVINQETLICNDIYPPSGYPNFNTPIALGDHMIGMGFNVFSIANNHTLDKGTEGLSACLDYWDSRSINSVVAVGAYRNANDRANIRTNIVNGVTFSYLSYTEHLNGLSLPAGSPLQVGDSNDIETMVKEVKRAKEISDICVVFLHWGVEDSHVITQAQRNVAQRLVDAGADVIVGTHPHVLRDIEILERANGTKAVVAYSLANLISTQQVSETMIGGLLKMDILYNPQSGRVEFDDVHLIPIITHYDVGNVTHAMNIEVILYKDYTAQHAARHGIHNYGEFGMDFIKAVLSSSVSSKWLK
ncbi:MAG: CapA family protein [Oscillospiraceae bacterium]|nr:CapA family protein [Oscillospiraceae bacterium]